MITHHGEVLNRRALTFVALKIVDIFQRGETLIGEPGCSRLAKRRGKDGVRTPRNSFEDRGIGFLKPRRT